MLTCVQLLQKDAQYDGYIMSTSWLIDFVPYLQGRHGCFKAQASR